MWNQDKRERAVIEGRAVMPGQHGVTSEERECARRRRLPELEEHHGTALPQQKRWPCRQRAATLLVLALGLGAAKAVGGTSIAGGDDSDWWSWAQNALNGGRRQAAGAAAGDAGGGGAANKTNANDARLVPYIAGCVRSGTVPLCVGSRACRRKHTCTEPARVRATTTRRCGAGLHSCGMPLCRCGILIGHRGRTCVWCAQIMGIYLRVC